MEIAFSKYIRTFIRSVNRFENDHKEGVLLRINNQFYLDYFPWEQFGDLSVADFLAELKTNAKLPDYLLRDLEMEKSKATIISRPFLNHHFEGKTGVVKIKFLNNFNELLEKINKSECEKIRIDFNSGLKLDEVINFWECVRVKDKIEYLEDPCSNLNSEWDYLSKLKMPLACDRVEAKENEYLYRIIKPNRDFIVGDRSKYIYSNYMGHELGMYHCFLHLMNSGDLSLYHGIVTSNIYKEQREIFNTKIDGKVELNQNAVNNMYEDLKERNWTSLI